MEGETADRNPCCAACQDRQVDKLTGLPDRWAWDMQAPEIVREAQGRSEPTALLLVDLDRFKAVNDTWGHPAGDTVLSGVADILRDVAGGAGLVGRYGGHGGDEFLVLLPDCGEQQALRIARRIRTGAHRLATLVLATSGEHVMLTGLTASIGVATCQPETETSVEHLVLSADAGLQRAKRQGRDQACLAGEADVPVQGRTMASAPVTTPTRCPETLDRNACLQHLLNFSYMMRGQWNPDILLALSAGPQRYSDLLATIRDSTVVDGWSGRSRYIQASILNRTLRRLERDGLVQRTEESGVWPRTVRYALTPAAYELLSAALAGVLWSRQHQDVIAQAQRRSLVEDR